jgi:hypothetical protein
VPTRAEQIQVLRETHKYIRDELKVAQRIELSKIREASSGPEKVAAVSVAKMQHVVQLTELAGRFKQERKDLFSKLAETGPGNTFREYLVREARKGDDIALGLARRYGYEDATAVLYERESGMLKIRAAVFGEEYRPTLRLQLTHRIEPSGTVVYHLGGDRLITDSALSRRVELNEAASHDAEAITTALRFASSKFGPVLTLTGPEEFQRLAVEIAVRERLAIQFADPALEAYREKLLAEQQTGSRRKPEAVVDRRGADLPFTPEKDNTASPASARSWAEEWGRANHKEVVTARSGGAVTFTVIHAAQDGIVLDMGRSIAVYPSLNSDRIAVGSKVTVGKNLEVFQQNYQQGAEKER